MAVTNRVVSRRGLSIAALCVAALAAGGGAHAEAAKADISGRWQGSKEELSRSKACSDGQSCNTITLDISACGNGWCGVEVLGGGTCGALALKMTQAPKDEPFRAEFKGTLTLAKSTEPYIVEVSHQVYAIGAAPEAPHLSIVGDTGGEFRFFRRTFPFHSVLSKTGPAACTPEKALSMLE